MTLTNEDIIEIIKIAEVKRINEKLTKKELAGVCGVSYNFYVNCTTGFYSPSLKMGESLKDYINTKTEDVYKQVFDLRKKEEKIDEKMNLSSEEFDEITSNLTEKGLFAGV